MLTGLTTGTAENIQLGAGAVLKSKYEAGTTLSTSNVLSATNGGITFSAVPTWFTPTIDGASQNTKGLRMITEWVVTLSFTAVEADASVLLKALGCAEQDSETGVITGKHKIASDDYADLYVIGEKANGDIIQITVKNALSTGGLNLTTTNNGNGGIAFTINGHYDLENMDEAPFEIETIAAEDEEETEPATEPGTNNGGVQG